MVPANFWRCAQETCGPGHVAFVVVVLRTSTPQVKTTFATANVYTTYKSKLPVWPMDAPDVPLNERSEKSDCYCDAA